MKRLARSIGLGAAVLLMATACGSSEPSAEVAATVASATYSTSGFGRPFEVSVPAWLPRDPSADEANFVTWLGEGAMVDRAVRFLVPVRVYEPGATSDAPVPDDYLGHLRGLAQHGGQITDELTTTVDGRPTTILTGTASASLDGSLGCAGIGMDAEECFGLQPYLVLRIAVIDVDGTTVVAWARVSEGSADAAEVFAGFEQMLASLDFR